MDSNDVESDRQNLVFEGDQEEVDGVEQIPINMQPHHPQGMLPSEDLNKCQILGFSIGHFYNDLCASMWFTYLMIFMEKVVMMRSYHAGFLMMIGQVTDGLSTPLVGLLSDTSFLPNWIIQKLGKRKAWHVIGTFCVTLSFPFIFGKCFWCHKDTSDWYKIAWYIPFIMLFQFGWACVQISHLSLIPELSKSDSKRMSMNSFRYEAATVIGPHDLHTFRNLDGIAVGVGLLTTGLFFVSVKEPVNRRSLSRTNSLHSQSSEIVRMSWKNWFSHVHFYQTALLYMFSRLFINISQVYFPFYITLSQGRSKEYVAVLPMISYLASFMVSCVLGIPSINHRLDRKYLFLLGSALAVLNCIFMFFELPGIDIFGVSVIQLDQQNTETSAFVYGAMSFLDKFSNGITCQVIEVLNPSCDPGKSLDGCRRFYRDVMVFIPGASAVAIFCVLLTLNTSTLGIRRRTQNTEHNDGFDEIVDTLGQ
uniref:Uncharacterized protein n=1 Tax=Ditylenchus dipsaci TaxID=166011 RepID=A0A915DAL7_9BILA